MAVTSKRTINVVLSGDLDANSSFPAATNSASPGTTDIFSLLSGDNTITLPTGGSTPQGCVILPPALNLTAVTLKGIGADTGIGLHLTDPTSLAFAAGVLTFVLNVGANLTGLRIVWT